MQAKATSSYDAILREAEVPAHPNEMPGPAYADEARLFQGIPSIECSPGNRLWATWYAGGQGESPLNYVLLATSGDGGETWSQPTLVIDPPGHVRAYDPNIWLDPQGRLWLFWMQAHTLHDGRWGVYAITTNTPDHDRPAWSMPRRLADGVMLNKPTVRSNREWLLPISHLPAKLLGNEARMLPAFLRQNIAGLLTPKQVRAIDERQGACVYASVDNGETFTCRGAARTPMEHATHNEHMVVERDDRSLWMLLRTSYGIGQSASTDDGATWEPVTDSGIGHTSSRFFLRRLRSGHLLLVKHGPLDSLDEDGNPRQHKRDMLTAYLSCDQGRSWDGGLVLEPRHCSYPDGTQGSDGTLYIVYDHDRRGAKEILMARFTEEDVLAKRFSSAGACQAMLVNQARGSIAEDQNWRHFKGKDDNGDPMVFTGI